MRELFLKVYGRVQGVFFRNNTQKLAQKLKINGWVKNAQDGTVEILAQGDESGLKKLREWAQKGPMFAKIEMVDAEYKKAKDKFDSFEIRY